VFPQWEREETTMARVELNTPAPDFTLPDLNGKTISLSDYRNRKNVLVVFNRGFI
jgi:peroxiredoxin